MKKFVRHLRVKRVSAPKRSSILSSLYLIDKLINIRNDIILSFINGYIFKSGLSICRCYTCVTLISNSACSRGSRGRIPLFYSYFTCVYFWRFAFFTIIFLWLTRSFHASQGETLSEYSLENRLPIGQIHIHLKTWFSLILA